MPLQLDADHPEAYLWVGAGGAGPKWYQNPPETVKMAFFARGRMALCGNSHQFIVPLDPPIFTPPVQPGPSRPETLKNEEIENI